MQLPPPTASHPQTEGDIAGKRKREKVPGAGAAPPPHQHPGCSHHHYVGCKQHRDRQPV